MKTVLNLPSFNVKIKDTGKRKQIFDVIRKKFVALTPEEWVRQHFVHYLISHKNFPEGLISLEMPVTVNKNQKRCDIVLYNKQAIPQLIVECKAPGIPINQNVVDQAAVYNMQLKVNYLVVTNGIKHLCCRIDYENKKYVFLEEIPGFNDL